jgi:hypothetical protein
VAVMSEHAMLISGVRIETPYELRCWTSLRTLLGAREKSHYQNDQQSLVDTAEMLGYIMLHDGQRAKRHSWQAQVNASRARAAFKNRSEYRCEDGKRGPGYYATDGVADRIHCAGGPK